MKRLILAGVIACAQLMLSPGRLFGSGLQTMGQETTMASVPPIVQQEREEYRLSLMRVEDDVLLIGGESYLGSKPQSTTKYPIIMLHGFLGWDQVFHLDYFYHIRSALQEDGFQVYAPKVHPVASIESRAKQLMPLLDKIFAETGAEKINIIAHSMGGLDARYLIAHGYGDRIASLTTIGTPHHGTPVPDLVFKVLGKKDNFIYKAFEFLVAGILGGGQVKPSDLSLRENLWNLSTRFMGEYFNLYYRDHPNVYYQSYAGASSVTGIKTGDRLDPILYAFQPAFKWGERNDGLVPEPSAKWGRYRGVVSADHINLIGQLFGATSARFDHVKFYKKIAWELVDLGL